MTNLNLRRFAAPADHSFGGVPEGAFTTDHSQALNAFIKEKEPTLKQCICFLLDRGVNTTPAVMEQVQDMLEFSSLEISVELAAQHPAGPKFAVTLVTEYGIVCACELVAELGQNTDLGELVQGVTAAGEFTLKGEYKAVVEALDAIYAIAWEKGSDDTNSLHILDSKGARQMWWTVLEEAGADPCNPGLKGQEKAVAPLFQQVQD